MEEVESADRSGFTGLLAQPLAVVRKNESPLSADELVEPDLILPAEDTAMEEAQVLFVGEDLLQG